MSFTQNKKRFKYDAEFPILDLLLNYAKMTQTATPNACKSFVKRNLQFEKSTDTQIAQTKHSRKPTLD